MERVYQVWQVGLRRVVSTHCTRNDADYACSTLNAVGQEPDYHVRVVTRFAPTDPIGAEILEVLKGRLLPEVQPILDSLHWVVDGHGYWPIVDAKGRFTGEVHRNPLGYDPEFDIVDVSDGGGIIRGERCYMAAIRKTDLKREADYAQNSQVKAAAAVAMLKDYLSERALSSTAPLILHTHRCLIERK